MARRIDLTEVHKTRIVIEPDGSRIRIDANVSDAEGTVIIPQTLSLWRVMPSFGVDENGQQVEPPEGNRVMPLALKNGMERLLDFMDTELARMTEPDPVAAKKPTKKQPAKQSKGEKKA